MPDRGVSGAGRCIGWGCRTGAWSNVLGVALHLFVCKILIEIYI